MITFLKNKKHFNAMEQRPFQKRVQLKNHKSRENKRSLLIFACLFLLGIFSINAQEIKQRIAVLDLYCTYNSDSYISIAKEITSILTTELVNTNKFRVIERSRIQQLIREQKLQSTQDISAQAVELGKLLGVNKIITGEYSPSRQSFIGYETLNVRLIDVETGDIEAAITIESCVRDKKGRIKFHLSTQEIVKNILIELFK